VPAPSPDSFAALARSSPWRWSTLRFTERRVGTDARDPLRAWLRRPDALRVETTDGELLQIVQERREEVGVLTTRGGRTRSLPWPTDSGVPAPDVRPDGLVAGRPSTWALSYDAPMYQDYFWVAMLDPVELAGQQGPEPAGPALTVDGVTEVEHAGRPAWEAVVRPTVAYEPRCGCCPLLRTRDVDVREWAESDVGGVLDAYPEAFRVRLDVGTGVCVLTEQIGGLTPGAGHDLRIEAVDEPMDDGLFVDGRWPWHEVPRSVQQRLRTWRMRRAGRTAQ
jgi:hypothetical protein